MDGGQGVGGVAYKGMQAGSRRNIVVSTQGGPPLDDICATMLGEDP